MRTFCSSEVQVWGFSWQWVTVELISWSGREAASARQEAACSLGVVTCIKQTLLPPFCIWLLLSPFFHIPETLPAQVSRRGLSLTLSLWLLTVCCAVTDQLVLHCSLIRMSWDSYITNMTGMTEKGPSPLQYAAIFGINPPNLWAKSPSFNITVKTHSPAKQTAPMFDLSGSDWATNSQKITTTVCSFVKKLFSSHQEDVLVQKHQSAGKYFYFLVLNHLQLSDQVTCAADQLINSFH